ncbi:MAG: hypothetical protein QOH08_2555 [Chloroflexota bacterium]|nr:hypothetical protein [Chloroflexota bacterium]
MIRLLIVEDHPIVAEGLELALSREFDIEIVASARSAGAGLVAAARTQPDVALVDYQLPDMPGAALVEQLRTHLPGLVVVMLTADASAQALRRSLSAGVAGFLLKTQQASEIASAIRRCAAGELALPARALAQLAPSPQRSSLGLTERETEVLRLVADGLDTKAVAEALSLSVHTVRGHVQSILEKTGTHSKLEAVLRGLDAGILQRP